MAADFKYKFGKFLAPILVLAYVSAAIIGIIGNIHGAQIITGIEGWMLWLGVIIPCLLILWFVPRGIDLLLLMPLAVYGGVHAMNLSYLTAGLIMGIPVLIVILLSTGRK